MLLLVLQAALAYDFGSEILLNECGWQGCSATQANFSLCHSVQNEDEYCNCVSAEAKRQYTGNSDNCVVLIDCLVDAACSDMATYYSQGVVTVYEGDACNAKVVFSGVLSPADGNCHRIHITSGEPAAGAWIRTLCTTTSAYIPQLLTTFYASRGDCEAQTNGRTLQFNTIVDAGKCNQHPSFPSLSWFLHNGACSHPKTGTLLPPNVGISGTIIPSQTEWLVWLPPGTTLHDGGLVFAGSTPSESCAAACGKIQLCDGWNLVGITCILFSSTTVGLRIEGAVSGRSLETFSASCVRWEATPTGAEQFNIKSSWCSEACTTNPNLEVCTGKLLPPYANVTAYTSCNKEHVAYSFQLVGDSHCHKYEPVDPAYAPVWAAGRCNGGSVGIAVYSTYDMCVFEGNATTPHPKSIMLVPGECSAGESGNLSWEVQSSCVTPAPEKACRCAAVTIPEGAYSNTSHCYLLYGELRGDVIPPDSSWGAFTPGKEGKDMWWSIQQTPLFYACGCSVNAPVDGSKKQFTGRLCQNKATKECSAPVDDYICDNEGTVLCEITEKEGREAIVKACQNLCLTVPGCAGFNVDAMNSKCKLMSALHGIDSYGMFIGGDCQQGPDQECALWHKTPGSSSLETDDCSQVPSAPCSLSVCHRVVAESGNLFPTITHCENNCQCIISTLSSAIPARIPECVDYISCLQTTQCSEWASRQLPRANCSCMSADIVQEKNFESTQCCARGPCGACEAWHSRGYCTLSQSNCIECGAMPCDTMNKVLVGELCACTRYIKNFAQVADSSKVCVGDPAIRTCTNTDANGECSLGGVLCDQCECNENCPHAECTAYPGFNNKLGSVAESCGCSVYASTLTQSSEVVCASMAYPRTCTPAYANKTCPAGAWAACTGTSPNKMLQVLWTGWGPAMMALHAAVANSVHLLFLCPAEVCPGEVCPYSQKTRQTVGCVNMDNGTLVAATDTWSTLQGFMGRDVVGGYLPKADEAALHHYGVASINATLLMKVANRAKAIIVDVVEYKLQSPYVPLIPSQPGGGPPKETNRVDANCEEYCTYLSVLFPMFVVMLVAGAIYYKREGRNVWWVHEELQQDGEEGTSYQPQAEPSYCPETQGVALKAVGGGRNQGPPVLQEDVPTHQFDPNSPNIATEAFPGASPTSPDPSVQQPDPSEPAPVDHEQILYQEDAPAQLYDPTNPNIATEAFPS